MTRNAGPAEPVAVRRRRQRGASLVENAIFLPIFIVLVLGFSQLALWGVGTALAEFAGRQACRTAATWYQRAFWGSGGASYGTSAAEAHRWLEFLRFADQGMVWPWGIHEVGIQPGVEGEREFGIEISFPLPTLVPYFGQGRSYVHTTTCRLEHYYP